MIYDVDKVTLILEGKYESLCFSYKHHIGLFYICTTDEIYKIIIKNFKEEFLITSEDGRIIVSLFRFATNYGSFVTMKFNINIMTNFKDYDNFDKLFDRVDIISDFNPNVSELRLDMFK